MEHVNCSTVVPMGPAEVDLLNPERSVRSMSTSVHFRTHIYNTTSFDVYVINRQNMKFKIVRSPATIKGKVVFRKGIGLSSQARHDLRSIVTTDDISNSKEIAALVDKWDKANVASAVSHQQSIEEFMYAINEDVLRAKKCIYLRDLDLVVCMSDHIANHPYSHQAQLKNRSDEVIEAIEAESGRRQFFTWNVFIIDNAGRIGPRWINIHGNVYRVRSCLDPNSTDGFYVVRDKPVNDSREQSVRTSDFKHSEEELDFPIYKTFQEALAANDTETVFKLRTTIEERAIKELTLETNLSRARADAERLVEEMKQQTRKGEEAEIAHQRDMEAIRETMRQERAKAEHERVKFEEDKVRFEHDKQTHAQKNVNETIKVVGAILTGVIGLLIIASKWLK